MRGASKRGHENEFCTKFWGSWRPYFRCSSSRTEKTCIYSHACTACSIVPTHAFVDLKSRTDRNTPSRLKIDFRLFKYNGFLCYNGYNGFCCFYRFSTCLRTELIGSVRIMVPSQSGWRPNEDMKMS